MNRPIRNLAIGCLVLFLALLLNINYVQVFKADELNARNDNRRARDAECARKRGPILVDGEGIARSVPSDDELEYQRKYSQPLQYAPVTGFFSCIYGTSQVENSENSILSGSDPRLFVSRVIELVGNNQPTGGSVLLTVNPDAQQAAWDGLDALPGDTQGAAVALDPDTGAILALVSMPSYDPNRIATHDIDAATSAYDELINSRDGKMRNRATAEIYPPGSTFKLVTAAAALSNGYTPDSMVQGGTALDLPLTSQDLHNEGGSDCGGAQITLTQALAVSCNVSFGSLGLSLGQQILQDQAEAFGFNSDPIDQLTSATSVFPTDMDAPSRAKAAIGQFDVAASPLQMAMVTAGIANDGDVMQPYVVQEVRSPDLDVLDEAEPQVLHHAVSGEVASSLTQMMVEVVDTGTGEEAQIDGISVAGKTGTANSAADVSPYAWMVAFAPADDPQVAVAVFVEKTEVVRDDISGGGLAGPIARDIMEAVIRR